MTISFSGLASGLDTSSWVDALVSVKQQKVTSLQSELTAIKSKKTTLTDTRSVFNNFRTAIEKLTDKKFGGSFDLFSQNTATSSNEEVFTATASSSALRQSYDISIQRLATATKATSKESASSIADDTTKLTNLGITEGSFTVYVDGVKGTVNIGANDTLGDFKSALSALGVDATIDEDGLLNLAAHNSGATIDVGATTDVSNLSSLVGLTRQDDGTYQSSSSLYKANISSVLTASDSGFNTVITGGNFVIGDATFTINGETTLSGLISLINNTESAHASAYWDDTTGKLSITSTIEGASYINIEAGTSNFTDVMGLTDTVRDSSGNILSSVMYTDAQELGVNAQFTINGTSMTSTSNTVSSDVSRLQGVTLTLKRANTDEDGQTTLRVAQDSSGLVEAVKNFVSAYNDTISKIDTVTAKDADFARETTLTSFKSTIRNYANGGNSSNGGAYHLLSQIGISTTKADGSNLSTDTNTLEFDESTFLQALEEDPSSLEAILAGDNSILTQMENAVEQTLKASVGFFDVKQSTINSDISKTEDKITRQQEKVTAYKTQLEKKFSAMETLIAQMQQNYSSFLSSSSS